MRDRGDHDGTIGVIRMGGIRREMLDFHRELSIAYHQLTMSQVSATSRAASAMRGAGCAGFAGSADSGGRGLGPGAAAGGEG